MFGRVKIAAMVLVVIFLFTGLTYAAGLKVVHPNGTESYADPIPVSGPVPYPMLPLYSGSVYKIKVKVNPDKFVVPVVKLELYYTLGDGWKLITYRYCGPNSSCYPTYPWEVPYVPTRNDNCKVKVKAYDAKGNLLAADGSNAAFTIMPYVPAYPK